MGCLWFVDSVLISQLYFQTDPVRSALSVLVNDTAWMAANIKVSLHGVVLLITMTMMTNVMMMMMMMMVMMILMHDDA